MPILEKIPVLATCRPQGGQHEIHAIEDASMVWRGDVIEWVGPAAELPEAYAEEDRLDAKGRLVVPGLVDCHTHLAFGGWRAEEFEMRCRGTSYQDIAQRGGGILSTVRATREMSEMELATRAGGFLEEMVRLGVTTVECKSGYALTKEGELTMLRAYRRLAEAGPARIVPTLLAAHVVPPEMSRAAYVDLICREIIPAAVADGLAEFCDVFVEEGAFDVAEARRILETGAAHGLRAKLHADQLTDSGGAALAADVGAVSADHLEFASDEGIRRMAERGVVAVNLPIASLYLRQPPLDARKWIDAGVEVAVATDFNPGSAPSYHLPLAMMLACTQSGMTPAEVLKAVTIIAARATARESEVGSLEAGKRADFIVVDAPSVDHWLYHFRPNAVTDTFIAGVHVEHRPSSAGQSGRLQP